MEVSNIEVVGWRPAFKGMRNPLNSWNKSDSYFERENIHIGKNDLKLAKRLIKSGPEHRKFIRYINVYMDLTAPLYFWKQWDTYKIGTIANSTSTMHTLSKTPITKDCFEINEDNLSLQLIDPIYLEDRVDNWINDLEQLRQLYLKTGDKRYWKELIRWLPESFLQTRTLSFNYETAYTIYQQRKTHKLEEWHWFCKILESLPYFSLLFLEDKE